MAHDAHLHPFDTCKHACSQCVYVFKSRIVVSSSLLNMHKLFCGEMSCLTVHAAVHPAAVVKANPPSPARNEFAIATHTEHIKVRSAQLTYRFLCMWHELQALFRSNHSCIEQKCSWCTAAICRPCCLCAFTHAACS